MKQLMLLFLLGCSDNSALDELQEQFDRELREQYCRVGAYTALNLSQKDGYLGAFSQEQFNNLSYKIDQFCENFSTKVSEKLNQGEQQ